MFPKSHPSGRRLLHAAVFAIAAAIPAAGQAAPGTLAQAPLLVSVSVKPNIFFVLDDSSSMQSEITRSTGAEAAHPLHTLQLAPHPANDDESTLALCAGYNVFAYNPTVTYTPWAGKDNSNSDFGDRTLLTGCTDPYDSATCVQDLTDRVYFTWTDDGDGDYDIGECSRPFNDGTLTAGVPGFFNGDVVSLAACAGITGCVPATSATAPSGVNAGTNFANWYSYYRNRDMVQKRAVSEVIYNADERMGMASLANRGGAATPVSDLGDTTPSGSDCGGTKTNKQCLLDRLFGIIPAEPRTPLRRALDEAGHYFDQDDGGFYHEYLGSTVQSPILDFDHGGHCQQNFVILVSDGFWDATWNLDGLGAQVLDSVGQWLAGHGDADHDGLLAGAAGTDSEFDRDTHDDGGDGTETCGVGFGGPVPALTQNTLADIAMHFYEKDLAPSLTDVVPTSAADENNRQHLVTFTVAFGVGGTINSDPPSRTDAASYNYWPPVCAGQATAVDDMRHAAWNGRGKFLSARDPASVGEALTEAISTIVERGTTTSAAASFNTGRLTTGSLIFQAQLDTSDWSGDLKAFPVGTDGTVAATQQWSAAAVLDDDALTTPADRVILTQGATDGVTFEWANLTAAQQSDLCETATACTAVEETLGQLRLAYLRGDRSCEDADVNPGCDSGVDFDGDATNGNDDLVLRQRGSRLGDIVNSGPVVVGAPTLNWPSAATTMFPTASGETYAEFRADNAGRTSVVYVGANDGMLHGFRESDGKEVVAYIPSVLFSNAATEGLHYLTDINYPHRFYVDRTPAISDVYIPSTASGTDRAWRTVAVGGLGAGGRGLYALDISDPGDFTPAISATEAASAVMWELTSTTDAELGYTLSQPIIAPTNAIGTNGFARWAAIVGSGYDDTGTNLNAHLFVVFLQEGLDGTWGAGDYIKIEAPIASLAERNGLSSPAVVDLDGNGTVDRVYAGDLLGNLWVFDLSDTVTNHWVVDGSGTPLFQAGSTQPITTRPQIAKHPSQIDISDGTTDDNQPNIMVYFGTGQYLTEADKSTTTTQAFYGVWDRGDFGLTTADLQQQTFDGIFANNSVVTDTAVDWTTKHGWYLNLPDTGERTVTDATLRGRVVFFNSLIPASTLTNPCGTGGSGFLYALAMENGGRPDSPAFDLNGDAVVDASDVVDSTSGNLQEVAGRVSFSGGIPTASTFRDNTQFTGDSEGGGLHSRAIGAVSSLDTGRLSWQQLYRN